MSQSRNNIRSFMDLMVNRIRPFTGEGKDVEEDLLHWKTQVSYIAEDEETLEKHKVQFLLATLMGGPLETALKARRLLVEEGMDGDLFNEIIKKIEGTYKSAKGDCVEEMYDIRQLREEKVTEYTERFKRLFNKIKFEGEDLKSLLLHWYSRGLDPSIRGRFKIAISISSTMAEISTQDTSAIIRNCCDLALKMERDSAPDKSYGSRPSKPSFIRKEFQPKRQEIRKCFNCGLPGHLAKFCRKKESLNYLEENDNEEDAPKNSLGDL